MTILSILTKEETFQLIDFLKTVGISFSGNLTAHEKREVEFYAPIVISRLAFEKMEQLNQNDLIINTDMAFEDMEQISKDNDEFEQCSQRVPEQTTSPVANFEVTLTGW